MESCHSDSGHHCLTMMAVMLVLWLDQWLSGKAFSNIVSNSLQSYSYSMQRHWLQGMIWAFLQGWSYSPKLSRGMVSPKLGAQNQKLAGGKGLKMKAMRHHQAGDFFFCGQRDLQRNIWHECTPRSRHNHWAQMLSKFFLQRQKNRVG